MTVLADSVCHSPLATRHSTARDWLTLTKPGVLLLVVFSGAAGMWLAPAHLHPLLQAVTLLSIAMGSASGAIFNMIYDRDIDAVMRRTSKRPLVTGTIDADDALMLAVALAILSVALLGLATNWMAAALLGFAIFFYAVIYTIWLKRSTPQNIVIGGAAGAFPPVIGWLATTGTLGDPLPWVLFLIIFLWTPPHFWALALFRNEDYRKAGIPMLPVVAGKTATTRQMLAYTLLLLPITLLPLVLLPEASWFYGVTATLLNLRFLAYAWQVHSQTNEKLSMKMFGFSIIYLFSILLLLLADTCL
jgi:heme o synthase